MPMIRSILSICPCCWKTAFFDLMYSIAMSLSVNYARVCMLVKQGNTKYIYFFSFPFFPVYFLFVLEPCRLLILIFLIRQKVTGSTVRYVSVALFFKNLDFIYSNDVKNLLFHRGLLPVTSKSVCVEHLIHLMMVCVSFSSLSVSLFFR